ncbi:MAG: pyruvate dehydrogenase (acetyl-transferring), homodimeric type, partial [Actinomycetota bacterium]|nr:pyruvate dehydrogenase (acetyl-transferring), homodimeric type [Actinomycetota bacterium]
DVIFYLTVYNEPVVQPPEPEGLDTDGLLRGIYRYRQQESANGDQAPRAQVLASGVAMPAALEAQRLLADEWGVAADVWSVTSWNELARDAVATDEWNFLHPGEQPRTPYVTQRLQDVPGPVLAVSDFMRAVPDQIAQWVPGDWSSLGTDGFGFADTRPAARRYFHVDAQSIVVGVLQALAERGEVKPESVKEAFDRYRIDDPTAVRHVKQEGGDA